MTPISPLPFVGFTVTLAGTVVSELSPAPYSNTKEVILSNQGNERIFVQVADVGTGLPVDGALTEANSIVIPALTSLSLCIGPEGERQPLATSAFWAVTPGANLNIVLQAETGVPSVKVHVAYVQNRGGGGGR